MDFSVELDEIGLGIPSGMLLKELEYNFDDKKTSLVI